MATGPSLRLFQLIVYADQSSLPSGRTPASESRPIQPLGARVRREHRTGTSLVHTEEMLIFLLLRWLTSHVDPLAVLVYGVPSSSVAACPVNGPTEPAARPHRIDGPSTIAAQDKAQPVLDLFVKFQPGCTFCWFHKIQRDTIMNRRLTVGREYDQRVL